MAATLIDGKAIASQIREQTARRVGELSKQGRPATLAAILIGDDASALAYARSQAKQAQSVGIEHRLVQLPATIPQEGAFAAVERLNLDPAVSGIMLHLPVPRPLDAFALQQRMAPTKDVEGVGAANLGLLVMGREALVPCTAAAAMACLTSAVPDLAGKEAVVIGRSVVVGKPLAMLLLAAHATVTQCHTRTRDLAAHTRRAELLLVAAGVPGLIGAEYVAPGAIVIDVGTHQVETTYANGKKTPRLVGDVRFDEVAPIAGAITPVPGGVGPVTVAMLLANTAAAAQRHAP
ncbi:MAG TPA: tetrahydrofolate dehydrogenase/cyclohydrolase catalytic domain-containing protein [Phycisphaerae bacterium]|nr:tetrahydrofolate dehydrogenase/cyclohydrolase catalytic domain-containing protein [Phycisphaerae bacterium]